MSTSNLAYTFDTRFAVSVLSFHVGLKTNKNEATNTPLTTPSIDRYNWENQVMFEILHTNSIHIFCCVLKMNIHAFICIVKLKRSSYKKESVFFNTYGESCLFFFLSVLIRHHQILYYLLQFYTAKLSIVLVHVIQCTIMLAVQIGSKDSMSWGKTKNRAKQNKTKNWTPTCFCLPWSSKVLSHWQEFKPKGNSLTNVTEKNDHIK